MRSFYKKKKIWRLKNRFLKEALSDNEKQDHEAQEKESLSNEMKELEELKETREQLTLENEKLRDENDFLVKQGKRLQSQVDRLEGENERLRNATSVTPRTGNYGQSQALVNEVIQNEAEIQLNMESSPGFHRGEVPSRTVAAQRFDEENQRNKRTATCFTIASKCERNRITRNKQFTDGGSRGFSERERSFDSSNGIIKESTGKI